MQGARKADPSKSSKQGSYELIETETARTGPSQIYTLSINSMPSTLVFYGIPGCANKCISDSCVLGSLPFVGLPYPTSI